METPALTTGVLFHEQTVEALATAVRNCKERSFDPAQLRQFALGFDREIYKNQMREYILRHWGLFRGTFPQS